MRLTCPNCGAQYEVPDEVIPAEGRDVQCSNCGTTWFHAHPDHTVSTEVEPPADHVEPEPFEEPEEPPSEPQPELPVEEIEPEVAAAPEIPDTPEDTQPETADALKQRDLDPSVADILREEAEHEARQRAAETGAGLESQPDLGLDDIGSDEAAKRSRESRSRMARMRGEEPAAVDLDPAASTRGDQLPDIDELNSTLRSSGQGAVVSTSVTEMGDGGRARRGGFVRGFATIFIIACFLVLLYINAGRISRAVPQTEPVLNAYIALVDQGRVWLDARIGGIMPK